MVLRSAICLQMMLLDEDAFALGAAQSLAPRSIETQLRTVRAAMPVVSSVQNNRKSKKGTSEWHLKRDPVAGIVQPVVCDITSFFRQKT
eukprot:6466442-Amphidinium_carterae.1